MPINHWPELERPREKLFNQGPDFLSDSELIAILLRTGSHGRSALDIAREIISCTGGLRQFSLCTFQDLAHIKGLGKTKFITLQAGIELAKRLSREFLPEKITLDNPTATKNYLLMQLRDLPREVFACLFLDSKNQIIKFEICSQGTIDRAQVYPREILKLALNYQAKNIIFAHNHPSGNATPSDDDILLTKNLQQALKHIEVNVHDHIIVGDNLCLSLAEMGLL